MSLICIECQGWELDSIGSLIGNYCRCQVVSFIVAACLIPVEAEIPSLGEYRLVLNRSVSSLLVCLCGESIRKGLTGCKVDLTFLIGHDLLADTLVDVVPLSVVLHIARCDTPTCA